MLLVGFHGGASPGQNNVFAYNTTTGALITQTALTPAKHVDLAELRALVACNGYLYVANGAKATSNVLCYQHGTTAGSFTYVSTVIGATLSKKGHFETSIAHPFGLAFDGQGRLFISNQDTNVVALAALSANQQTATLGSGCQSAYLNGLYPKPAVFLDGTWVASQNGTLHDVEVAATNVPASQGGLGVTLDSSQKVQNSVRDVAVANGIVLVCDEPDSVVNLYALNGGAFLGSSNALATKPTHLALFGNNVFVSAGSQLYWGMLPTSVHSAQLALQPVAIAPPAGNKIGGISFDNAAAGVTVYVAFQQGTGGADGGSVYTFTVTQSSPCSLPVFAGGAVFVQSGPSTFQDTPEFVLYLPD